MHPMYQHPKPNDPALYQGDIIDRGELIHLNVLKGHQDYIASRDDFPAFCVVSQSCDLVCDRCVDFITLAVVRHVSDVFDSTGNEKSLKTKLARLINHSNDDKSGHFYLHREPSIGIDEGAVVDLRVMFSLRSTLHYPQLVASRKLSMTDTYANKLGWVAGYLFSRVPLKEWAELKMPETEEDVVNRLVGAIKRRGGPKLPHEKPL